MTAPLSSSLLGALPTPRTALVGRDAEIRTARTLLVDEAVPLLTLTGPGGVGKTRLALALGHEVAAHFSDGAVFVDLSSLNDPDLVLPTVARTLGVAERGDRSLAEQLTGALHRLHLLLVLDNCEHVLTAVAEVVSPSARRVSHAPGVDHEPRADPRPR